ncbi:hypothetical protein Ancab_018974 [Ancistrocladus abbreviatus]
MGLFTSDYHWRASLSQSCMFIPHLPFGNAASMRRNTFGFIHAAKVLSSRFSSGFLTNVKAFAHRKSVKKLKREEKNRSSQTDKSLLDDYNGLKGSFPSEVDVEVDDFLFVNANAKDSISIPSRSSVLQACTVTSGVIAALGGVIQQVSHAASSEGLPILDCSALVSFDFEAWHLALITGLVVSISLSRYLLLKTWPDFADSSEAANRQVLTSLGILDYIVVAFLPGISEELLFRGALLPLFGLNWKSALAVAAVFGILHLGSGRKYSFAICSQHLRVLHLEHLSLTDQFMLTLPRNSENQHNSNGGICNNLAPCSPHPIPTLFPLSIREKTVVLQDHSGPYSSLTNSW